MDSGSVVWLCRCDCGRDAEVSARRLVRGKVRSCGCLSHPPFKDYTGARFGRLTVTGYAGCVRKKNTMNYWNCRCDCGSNVTVAQTELQNGETQSCGCLQAERARQALKLIDDTSVRILERVKRPRANNKSGCTGVYHTKDGRWAAYINFQKKRYWLGRFTDKKDAIQARKQGEQLHDDFLAWYYYEYLPAQQKEAEKATIP